MTSIAAVPESTSLLDGFFTMQPRYTDTEIQDRLQGCHTVGAINTTWRLTEGTKSKVKKNLDVLGNAESFSFSRDCLFVNPQYTNCDFDRKHLKIINKFMQEHPYISSLLSRLNLNVTQQVTAIRTINRAAKKYGKYVIGLLETEGNINEITAEAIDALVSDYASQGQLKDPEDLDGFPLKDYCEEIVTTLDLLKHGDEMEHCVGGYGNAIKAGRSIIFNLTMREEISTIEYRPIDADKNKKRLVQHRAKRNKMPSANHRALALLLTHHLNGTLDEKVFSQLSVILNGIDIDKRLAENYEPDEAEIMCHERKETEFETVAIIHLNGCLEAVDDIKYLHAKYVPSNSMLAEVILNHLNL